jgi:Zn-dependent protease
MSFMSWKLGRVAGIDVFLHPTFLLLLAFVAMTQGGIASVVLMAAVFGCVLLHELGHALTARQFGIATQDITLYPIGGVARLRDLPRDPGAELLIALAGPAVNVMIALALVTLRWLGLFGSPWNPSLSLLTPLVDELIVVNVILALFNLIPAFPMDGGRVLRALLSGWLGRARATTIAAGIGRGLALAFGIYSLMHGSLIQVVLAWFIYVAAGQELARVLAEERAGWSYSSGRSTSTSTSSPGHAASEGIWTAPPGYRWVSLGSGVWQLAPIVVAPPPRPGERVARPWS